MEKKFAPNTTLSPCRVTGNEEISSGTFLLSLEKKSGFIPGQIVFLTTHSRIPPRMYSIASGSEEKEIRILFDRKEQGMLSPQLARCRKGDTLFISQPFGTFVSRDEPAWWISSGTGIAPFASMFYSGNFRNKRLIHGARNLESFYFQEDFLKTLGINYIRCCSGENAKGVYHGRITQWLEKQDTLPANILYYLCGKAEMVVDVRQILLDKKVPFGNIMAEIYF